jgi:predicted GTPase
MRKKVIIVGAAGRDFHNFNVFFRDNQEYEVVAFTAAQIPDIDGRPYPKELSGELYPNGIPIYPEEKLKELIQEHRADFVVFAYSDVPHERVMHLASLALSSGSDYMLLGPRSTMVKSSKPVIATGAIRTGCGKSQTSRKIVEILQRMDKKVVVIRHPMPYGDLAKQIVQRFETYDDLSVCTIEEREEYESHIDAGTIVYAGVDYEKILRQAEKEADIVLWDGGNNDFPFYHSDIFIVLVDPLRPGDELRYHPGETCLRMACTVIINKVDSAKPDDIERVKKSIASVNPDADIIEAQSTVYSDNKDLIKGKTVLVVEDGPTLTHGSMSYGAGLVAAKRFGARAIVDPRPYAVGSISETYKKYPDTGEILPAMGYSPQQIKDLESTIQNTPCDTVIVGTPMDLRRIVQIDKPCARVTYELEETGKPDLEEILVKWMKSKAF